MSVESLLGIKCLDLVCEFAIKSSLILCVSLLLVFILRKKSASIRHFLLSFSLISLLFLPFFSTFTTGWQTKWLPNWQSAENNAFNVNEGGKNKDALLHLNKKDNTNLANTTHSSGLENIKNKHNKAFFLKATDTKTFLGLSMTALWTAGIIFLLLKIILGLYGAHRLTRQGKLISGKLWRMLLQRFLAAVAIKRKISLLSHEKVKVPLTWGVIKPVVIMPAEARNWNEGQRSSALFHELSHVKRSDFLINILARFSCSLFWFNPLSWFVFRLMKEEQEKACDQLVLKAGVKPSTYAANLLSIQRGGHLRMNPPATVLGAVGKSQLNERLLAILKQQLNPGEVKMKTKILISAFVIAAITLTGLARPSASTASDEAFFMDNDVVLTDTQNSAQSEGVQEEQEKKKTEKAEKKESTEKKEKKIIITGKPIVITKKDLPTEGIALSISGKDMILKKGEAGHWTLKADKLHLITEDKAKVIKLDKDNVFKITIEKGKDGKNFHIIKCAEIEIPEIQIAKAVKVPLSYKIHVDPHVYVKAVPLPHLDISHLIRQKIKQTNLKVKLEKLREKLKNFKELPDEIEETEIREETLKAVEDVLKELKEELEIKCEELEDLELKIKTDIKYQLEENIKHIKACKDDFITVDISGDKKIICVTEKDEDFQIIITSKLNSENRGEYEEILKKLKQELPDDYKAESKIDEKNNTITITITSGKKDEKSNKEVKELVKHIVEKTLRTKQLL